MCLTRGVDVVQEVSTEHRALMEQWTMASAQAQCHLCGGSQDDVLQWEVSDEHWKKLIATPYYLQPCLTF